MTRTEALLHASVALGRFDPERDLAGVHLSTDEMTAIAYLLQEYSSMRRRVQALGLLSAAEQRDFGSGE